MDFGGVESDQDEFAPEKFDQDEFDRDKSGQDDAATVSTDAPGAADGSNR